MRLRRFIGADVAAATRQVREHLGPDAVILSTRAHPDGIEITAAVDAELVMKPLAEPDVMGELRAIRAQLDRTLARQAETDARAVVEACVFAECAPHDARITAFVGATGVGKTTTIAKLAAARRTSALVMADTYRIGAAEQLGTYARLLGVPMKVARDGTELRDALRAFADREQVLIDTTGLSGDGSVAADVTRLLQTVSEPLAIAAVVSAATSAGALERIWAHMEPLAPTSCVLTKLDEDPNAGVCGWLASRRVPLRFLGVGPRVPEDLVAASPAALASYLVAA